MIVGAVNTSRRAASMLLRFPRGDARPSCGYRLPLTSSIQKISIVVLENLHEINIVYRDRIRSVDVRECG
jgi:hypothetical protein